MKCNVRGGGLLITIPEMNKFFDSVNKTEDCWEWIGYKDKAGYARLMIRSQWLLGHVLSYLLHFGPIPGDLHVCHSCDNPCCVNPNHLWLGTHQQNMKDRNDKGRCGQTERNGEMITTAILTSESAAEIRKCVAQGAKQSDMAKRFGVTRGTINSLIKRRTWKQVV